MGGVLTAQLSALGSFLKSSWKRELSILYWVSPCSFIQTSDRLVVQMAFRKGTSFSLLLICK